MKKFLLLISIFLIGKCCFAHFDMNTPVEGSSIASDDLQFEVVEDMYKFVYPLAPSCTDYRIKNTQVIHFPYDVKKKNGKYIKGYWKELWSVDYCGNVLQFPVTFNIKGKKTTYNIDTSVLID